MPEAQVADQAEPQSVEDRIAAQFGVVEEQEAQGEPQVEGQEAEVESVPETDVEVEYEGERFKIPKQLEKAILQERDYTRKAQELADQRRQVEHEKQVAKAHQMDREFRDSVAQEQQQIVALDNYLRHLEGVDVRALSMDDQIAHLAELQRIPRQREAIQRQIDGKRQEFDNKVKETIESIRQSARETLSKSIPGFDDKIMESVGTYAKTLGFTEQDVYGITSDPRSSSVLYKAMRYDQLQANKSDAVKKATTANPVLKPGSSNPMPQAVKDKLAYKKALSAAKTRDERNRIVEKRIEGYFS